MKSLIKVVDTISVACAKFGYVLSVVWLAGIVVSISTCVFSREILGSQVMFTEELSRYLMVSGAFIAGSVAMQRQELIKFDFLVNLLPGKVRIAFQLVMQFVVLAFLTVFMYQGIQAIDLYTNYKSTTMPITLMWPASGLLIGGAFMYIHGIDAVLHSIYNLFTKAEPVALPEGGGAA